MKETYEFEKWLEQIEEKVQGLSREEKLEVIAEEIYSRYGVRVWFSEVLGKRWSHIVSTRLFCLAIARIKCPLTARCCVQE